MNHMSVLTGKQVVTVAGGGSWGTALAQHLAEIGHDVTIWMRNQIVADEINRYHKNSRYLPDVVLNSDLCASTDPQVLGCGIVVLSIPCQQLRPFLVEQQKHFFKRPILINTAKGLERISHLTCSAIVSQCLSVLEPRYATLSGPSFAAGVVRGLPTAVVLATEDTSLGEQLRLLFSGPTFRCYSSRDVAGVEFAGAVKNVMAIATGVCDALGLGDNSRAALITRGLAEISRIGVACGAQAATFSGLSGLGDLVLTCTGDLSRNRQVGLRLGRGEKLESITSSLGMVAEGVATARAVHELADSLKIEAPISSAVHAIIDGRLAPAEAVKMLMNRALREE